MPIANIHHRAAYGIVIRVEVWNFIFAANENLYSIILNMLKALPAIDHIVRRIALNNSISVGKELVIWLLPWIVVIRESCELNFYGRTRHPLPTSPLLLCTEPEGVLDADDPVVWHCGEDKRLKALG